MINVNAKRGRPKSKDPKLPVALVRLTAENKAILETMAHNSNISLYKYIDKVICDLIDDYRESIINNLTSEYDYEEPEYWVDEDGMYHEGPEPEEEEERFSLGSLFNND